MALWFSQPGREAGRSYLEGLLRHDDVLAASVARGAVAREDLLARTGIARKDRRGGDGEGRSGNDRRDLVGGAREVHVDLREGRVEGERVEGEREPAEEGGGGG